jgi:hypothetical protein
LRTRGSQVYIIAFLVVTIAIGIFNSQTARTINSNEESPHQIINGAEIVLEEPWINNMADVAEDDLGVVKLTYTEPDSRKYYELDGVKSITKVIYDNKASCSSANNRWTSATVRASTLRSWKHRRFRHKPSACPLVQISERNFTKSNRRVGVVEHEG